MLMLLEMFQTPRHQPVGRMKNQEQEGRKVEGQISQGSRTAAEEEDEELLFLLRRGQLLHPSDLVQ